MSMRAKFPALTVLTRIRPAEMQRRAREYLEQVEAELVAKCKKLGVKDELRQIEGMTSAIMVKAGEDGVKTIEDFAGYAADDLVGWKERKDGETTVNEGVLSGMDISRAEAEQMIMSARLKAGWVTEEELAAEAEPVLEEAGA